MRPIALAPALLLLACTDVTPLRSIPPTPSPSPAAPVAIPDAPDDEEVPPEAPPQPWSCGEVVAEGLGHILDLDFLGEQLVLATTRGLLRQDAAGGFEVLDPGLAWTVRASPDGTLLFTTSTALLWDSFSLLRLDPQGTRTVLLAPADLRALTETHASPAPPGLSAHAVVTDFARMGDRLMFAVDHLFLDNHMAVGTTPVPAGTLFSMPADGGGPPQRQADLVAGGALSVDPNRGEIYIAPYTVERYRLDGSHETLFDDGGVSAQRMAASADALFVTSALNGAVVRIDKETGATQLLNMSAAHWDADVAVADGWVYWAERDFDPWTGGQGRVRRAPVEGGDAEVLSDCVPSPSRLKVHGGAIWLSGDLGDGSVLVRLPVPS
jgi:hypothetical protein